LKKVIVVEANEVEVKPFCLEAFIEPKVKRCNMKSVTKKELRALAESLQLPYTKHEIAFAKKLITQLCK
jgi:hypothetical protein